MQNHFEGSQGFVTKRENKAATKSILKQFGFDLEGRATAIMFQDAHGVVQIHTLRICEIQCHQTRLGPNLELQLDSINRSTSVPDRLDRGLERPLSEDVVSDVKKERAAPIQEDQTRSSLCWGEKQRRGTH